MKHPAEIVLRAMLQGIQVELDGVKYSIQDGNLVFHVTCYHLDNGIEEEGVFGSDMSLAYFLKACEQMSEEQKIGLVGALGLQGS